MNDAIDNLYIEANDTEMPQAAQRTLQRLPQAANQLQPEGEQKGFFGDLWGGLKESHTQVVGGGIDAVNEIGQAVESVYDWGMSKFDVLQDYHEEHPDLGMPQLETMPEAETNTGGIIRSATQFLTAFVPYAGTFKAMGVGNALVRGTLAGAGADMTAFDPHEERLSNLINDLSDNGVPVFDYLAADPNDTDMEGRFKNALEGAGLGLLTEGVFRSLRALKKTKGPEAKQIADQAMKDVPKEFEEALKDPNVDWTKFRVSGEPPKPVTPKDVDGFVKDAMEGKVNPEDWDYSRFNTVEDYETLYGTYMKDAQKRQVRSISDVKKQADEMGFDVDVDGLKTDTSDLPQRIVAASNMSLHMESRMSKLAKKYQEGNLTNREWIEGQKLSLMMYDTAMKVKGAKSDIGRALRACNPDHTSFKGMLKNDVEDFIIDMHGGKKVGNKFFEKFMQVTDRKTRMQFIRDRHKATKMEKLQYYWINSLLSGPATQTRNFVGNFFTQALKVGEVTTASMKVGGDVKFSDAISLVKGMMSGALESLALPRAAKNAQTGSMWKTLKTGESTIDAGRNFMDRGQPVPDGPMGGMAKLLHTAVGAPTRVMATADEFFKTMSYRGDLYMQANQAARKQGIKGTKELNKFVADFVADPPAHALQRATQEMRVATFQNDLGTVGKKVQELSNAAPMAKFVMPFIRTPVNILKYVGHRTPLINQFSKQMQADIAAGGVRKELAEAKMRMGAMMYSTGMLLAAQGKIKGAYDKDQSDSDKLIGLGGYKMTLDGKTWMDISTADPMGAFLTLAADGFDLANKADDMSFDEYTSAAIGLITNNLTSKSYLQGLSDMLTAFTDNNMEGANQRMKWWSQNFVSSFVPNIMAQMNRSWHDDTMREMMSFKDSILRKIPGASQGIPPRRNPITGEPMKYGEFNLGGLNPFYFAEEDQDPALQELSRLQMAIKNPRKTMGGVDLTPEQYDRLQMAITQETKDGRGRTLHDRLKEVVEADWYKELPEDASPQDGRKTKQWVIEKVLRNYRNHGKKRFLQEFPEVNQKIGELKLGLQ